MRKIKYKSTIMASSLMILLAMTGCGSPSSDQDTQAVQEQATEGAATNESSTDDTTTENGTAVNLTAYVPTASELAVTWDDSATMIDLADDAVTITGEGATAAGSSVTVTAAGVYVVSGSLTDGQIVIDAAKEDEVRLVLNGAEITNQSGAAVEARTTTKLIVTLAEGSQNRLTDGGSNFVYADAAEEEPNAALFAKNDLTINGTGSLTVTADFKNGIGAKGNLVIISGDITVMAENNGLRGTDAVNIIGGNINLTAGNDGIQSGNNVDGKGNVQLEGGSFTINAGGDGIQSDNGLLIGGGDYVITAGGGADAVLTDTTVSYKGIKAATDLTVTGGNFTIDSPDDGFHAGGNLTVADGLLVIASGDDGIHSDADVAVSGGEIRVERSYEGVEGSNIFISGGVLELSADDDAINAAGGSDNGTDGGNGRFGQDSFAGGGDYAIKISGGTIRFKSGGDGIDSNGTIDISGGEVEAIIDSSADNTALDSDGATTVNGGTVAAGGTGAVGMIAEGSQQSYVYVSGVKAGEVVGVEKAGQELVSYEAEEDLAVLALFAPGITAGEEYDVTVNGVTTVITAGTGGGGFGGGGRFGNGERPERGELPEGMELPEGGWPERGELSEGMEMPEGWNCRRAVGPGGVNGRKERKHRPHRDRYWVCQYFCANAYLRNDFTRSGKKTLSWSSICPQL